MKKTHTITAIRRTTTRTLPTVDEVVDGKPRKYTTGRRAGQPVKLQLHVRPGRTVKITAAEATALQAYLEGANLGDIYTIAEISVRDVAGARRRQAHAEAAQHEAARKIAKAQRDAQRKAAADKAKADKANKGKAEPAPAPPANPQDGA